MNKFSSILCLMMCVGASVSSEAKPSVYFGMNVNLPVQQQTTITHHVQPILPNAQVQHYQATYSQSSQKDHWGVPRELSRFSKPTSVYYQPPYPENTSRTVVYVPTTVVYQTNHPYQTGVIKQVFR